MQKKSYLKSILLPLANTIIFNLNANNQKDSLSKKPRSDFRDIERQSLLRYMTIEDLKSPMKELMAFHRGWYGADPSFTTEFKDYDAREEELSS